MAKNLGWCAFFIGTYAQNKNKLYLFTVKIKMESRIIPYPLLQHASEPENWVSVFCQKIQQASGERAALG